MSQRGFTHSRSHTLYQQYNTHYWIYTIIHWRKGGEGEGGIGEDEREGR